jgi:hypothetical protein
MYAALQVDWKILDKFNIDSTNLRAFTVIRIIVRGDPSAGNR